MKSGEDISYQFSNHKTTMAVTMNMATLVSHFPHGKTRGKINESKMNIK